MEWFGHFSCCPFSLHSTEAVGAMCWHLWVNKNRGAAWEVQGKRKDCRGTALRDQRRFGFGDLETPPVKTGCTFPPQTIPWRKWPERRALFGVIHALSEAPGYRFLFTVESKMFLFFLCNGTFWLSLWCPGSCPRPPSVPSATISPEDQRQNFYAVNTTVRYICRPGYENSTDQLPTSTCLDDLTWTQVPRLCQSECLHVISFSPMLCCKCHVCILKLLFSNDI